MATKKIVKVSTKKVAAKKVTKAAVAARKHVTSEQYKLIARRAEAVMGALLSVEGLKVSGTNFVQAAGQGRLAVKVNGERVVTAKDQLEGKFAKFDGEKSDMITAASLGSDYPLNAMFDRQGLRRLIAQGESRLMNDPKDQVMIDGIYNAIKSNPKYAPAFEVQAKTTRTRGQSAEVENPNPLFD